MYKNKSLEERIEESTSVLKKYPNRIPVIVEKSDKCKELKDIDKNKYLVPDDLTFGQFIFVVRKRLKLSADKSLFLFVNNTLIPSMNLMKQVYEQNADKDGFLYILYTSENTFG